jgi:hypothetical protein
MTSFCASSAVERVHQDEELFTQTYSLAQMSKSKLFVEIMEYRLEWWENRKATPKNTKFT